MRTLIQFSFLLSLAGSAWANDYDEALQGDLSNDRLNPTQLALDPGTNTLIASQGQVPPLDRDYLTITVPAGSVWTGLNLVDYQAVQGNQAFMGFQSGTTFTVTPQAAAPSDMLGALVYSHTHIGTDILPTLDNLPGVIGYTIPLPAGDYTFWLNQTGAVTTLTLEFEIQSAGSLGSSYCGPAVNNSTGGPGVITALGSSVASTGNLSLSASSLPNNQFAYYLASQTQAFVMGPGGSAGNLCLGGTIGRFNSQVGSTGGTGTFGITVNTGAIPTSPSQPILAGQTWNFQLWYRDAGGTSNFTDAVSVPFS